LNESESDNLIEEAEDKEKNMQQSVLSKDQSAIDQ